MPKRPANHKEEKPVFMLVISGCEYLAKVKGAAGWEISQSARAKARNLQGSFPVNSPKKSQDGSAQWLPL